MPDSGAAVEDSDSTYRGQLELDARGIPTPDEVVMQGRVRGPHRKGTASRQVMSAGQRALHDLKVSELKKRQFKGVSNTLNANKSAAVQNALRSQGRNPSRLQHLRQQQHQAMGEAGGKPGIPKGPIVDTAATIGLLYVVGI